MSQLTAPLTGFQIPDPSSAAMSPTTPFTATTADGDEESDEWEYEYSTTETESYYLTLDLTNPDLLSDKPTRQSRTNNDGPLRTRWHNPGLGRNRPGKHFKPATYSTINGTNNSADTPEPEVEDDENEEEDEPAPNNASRVSTPTQDNDADPTEVQIIDLHTARPLIAYDGSVYSCQWARNIGTELLFTAHDRDSTLPLLRKLVGGVDLLAASTARIISNQVELEPRKRPRSPDRLFTRGSQLKQNQRMIPVGPGAMDRRKDQATFLERLMEIKQENGESDEVTIVAEKRMTNSRWKDKHKQMRAAERTQLQKTINNHQRKFTPAQVASATERLREIDEETRKIANKVFKITKRNRTQVKNGGRKTKGLVGAVEDVNGKPKLGRPRQGVVGQPAVYSEDEEEEEIYATPGGDAGNGELEANEEVEDFYSADGGAGDPDDTMMM